MASPSELAELPLETRCPPFALRQYAGFWLPETVLARGLPALRDRFARRPDDVLLASFPKSGTTWLKALAFATARRAVHPPSDNDHPLRHRSPHDCVPFLEISLALADKAAELEALPFPRVLATHLPCSLLPERIRSRSRIVYVCRNPKDALVSSWLFTRKASENVGVDAESFSLREAVELFCAGRFLGGPQWQHVVEYWEASLGRRNEHRPVLFLRYEEMLHYPVANLRAMAEFMGCAFSREEEEQGVDGDRAIAELCSMEKLKNMEANRKGRTGSGVKADAFFRKGVAGDWSSHMTPEMGKMVDEAVEDGLRGSGFSFADSTPASH